MQQKSSGGFSEDFSLKRVLISLLKSIWDLRAFADFDNAGLAV